MEQNVHRSTKRVIEILESLRLSGERGLSLTEIADTINAPKSSIFPIVQTLANEGLLVNFENTGKYKIGFKTYELGSAYLMNGASKKDILSIMNEIVSQTSETCYYGELIDGDVFYLHKVDSPESIRMVASPGKKLPAYSAAIGKALLSDYSWDELNTIYPGELKAMTENTLTDKKELFQQLQKINREGISYENEESTPHVRCVAVPICKENNVVYGLSIATPIFRYSKEKETKHISLLLDAKKKIEHLLEV